MADIISIVQWWAVICLIGLIFLPLANTVFNKFYDLGYSFSKVLGIGILSYLSLVFGIFKLIPFNTLTLIFIIWVLLLGNFFILSKTKSFTILRKKWKIMAFEEMLFLAGIFFWAFIRSHEPNINGLEKFMDFGFLNSILRSSSQPAVDMWFTPLPINYYYFGHFVTAILTKLSYLPSYITYNLMIATLFSFSLVLPFSLFINIISRVKLERKGFVGGLIAGALVSLGGNIHTIYSFFRPYNVDAPVPFWNLTFNINAFPNDYWYPNATRFIPFTIHEFPLYSFVVSDLHGHVVDIMFVMLGIALIYVYFVNEKISKFHTILISLFLSIMYMTNAWDGLIYMVFMSLAIFFKKIRIIKVLKNKNKFFKYSLKNTADFIFAFLKTVLSLFLFFVIFSIPFSLNFKPFASGIGILCAPEFLVNIGKIGPLMFEADHCQKSTWWQLLTLYGFFFFFALSFIVFAARVKKLLKEDTFILLLILVSLFLITVPEILYVKDIYPAHYRANTMFKLVYQAFMILSIVSAYSIVRIVNSTRNILFYLSSIVLITLVLIYPYFAIKSYYGNLSTYKGLDGTIYLKERRPGDYASINWINNNITGRPVIVEAQGDSYTDYGRISANTGLPTILGWTVHEWLWRGSYNIPAPRIEDVRLIYESESLEQTKLILMKYEAHYIYVGDLEREKYPKLIESKFENLGNVVYKSGNTRIYELN